MNEMRKSSSGAQAQSTPCAAGQVSPEIAQQWLNCTQAMASAIVDLNQEMTQFVSRRMSRSSEAMARLAGCTSLPQMLDAEVRWMQEVFDDYSAEAGKLAEVNARLLGAMMGPVEAQAAAPAKAMASAAE